MLDSWKRGDTRPHLGQHDLTAIGCVADFRSLLDGWPSVDLVPSQDVVALGHSALARPVQPHAHARPGKQQLPRLGVCTHTRNHTVQYTHLQSVPTSLQRG